MSYLIYVRYLRQLYYLFGFFLTSYDKLHVGSRFSSGSFLFFRLDRYTATARKHKGRKAMEERIGQQLGNYRLIRLLGQGGFADVYLYPEYSSLVNTVVWSLDGKRIASGYEDGKVKI